MVYSLLYDPSTKLSRIIYNLLYVERVRRQVQEGSPQGRSYRVKVSSREGTASCYRANLHTSHSPVRSPM